MPLGSLPIGAVVRLVKTNEFALIVGKNQMMNQPDSFLNYYVEVEGRNGIYATYDADIELECLPEPRSDSLR